MGGSCPDGRGSTWKNRRLGGHAEFAAGPSSGRQSLLWSVVVLDRTHLDRERGRPGDRSALFERGAEVGRIDDVEAVQVLLARHASTWVPPLRFPRLLAALSLRIPAFILRKEGPVREKATFIIQFDFISTLMMQDRLGRIELHRPIRTHDVVVLHDRVA